MTAAAGAAAARCLVGSTAAAAEAVADSSWGPVVVRQWLVAWTHAPCVSTLVGAARRGAAHVPACCCPSGLAGRDGGRHCRSPNDSCSGGGSGCSGSGLAARGCGRTVGHRCSGAAVSAGSATPANATTAGIRGCVVATMAASPGRTCSSAPAAVDAGAGAEGEVVGAETTIAAAAAAGAVVPAWVGVPAAERAGTDLLGLFRDKLKRRAGIAACVTPAPGASDAPPAGGNAGDGPSSPKGAATGSLCPRTCWAAAPPCAPTRCNAATEAAWHRGLAAPSSPAPTVPAAPVAAPSGSPPPLAPLLPCPSSTHALGPCSCRCCCRCCHGDSHMAAPAAPPGPGLSGCSPSSSSSPSLSPPPLPPPPHRSPPPSPRQAAPSASPCSPPPAGIP